MNFSLKAGLILSMLVGLQVPAFSEGIGLEEVIREVSTKSDSAKILQETVTKSKMQIKEQWANALPTVSTQLFAGEAHGIGLGLQYQDGDKAGAGAVVGFDSTNAYKGDINNYLGEMMGAFDASNSSAYNATINISQPLYTFGKVGAAVKVANFYDSSNQLSYTRGIQNLQLLGLDNFYKVVLAEMSLSITERSLERKKELNEFLTRNFELGKGSKAEILSTNADLVSLWPVIVKARQNSRTAKMQLCVMMGRPMTDSIQLDTASTLQSVLSQPLPSREDAVKAALNNRSDLQSLDYLRKANDGGVKIFKANYLPSIVGQFSFGTKGIKPQDLVDLDTRDWKVGIGVNWTMFDGFANSAKASQYRSDSRKLQIAKNSYAKFIEIEIEGALTDCIVADSNLPVSKIVFAAAQEAYDLTAENFKQGDGKFAELQLAEERLRQSEMDIMNARYMQIRSRAALLVAMGRTIIPTEGK